MDVPKLDDQLRFYFERQKVIDQWAELPKRGQQFANEFFQSLASAVKLRADGFGVRCETWPIGSDQIVGLFRPDWIGPGDVPRVTVALGWTRDIASFVGDGTPWVGIRVRRSDPHEATSAHVVPILLAADGIDPAGDPYVKDQLWPRWRDVPSTTERFWEHLDAYGQELIDALFAAWDAASPVLDGAMRSAPSLPTD